MSVHIPFLIDKPGEILDRFYTQNGPCCAGCDWWAYLNSLVGECRKSAPVSGVQRVAMLGASRVPPLCRLPDVQGVSQIGHGARKS